MKIHFRFLIAVLLASAPALSMDYVPICNRAGVCKEFSRLVMGTDHLVQSDWTKPGQAEPTDEQAFAVLDEAAKLGINFFDTSPIYVGGVENRLGKWRKSREVLLKKEFHVLSKGGFPFDLYWAKKLETGTHSPELKKELQTLGILEEGAKPGSEGTISLKDVPPGTYASRLYGEKAQITSRVSEELGHSLDNLGDVTIYLMHRDDGDAVKFKAVERTKTPVRTVMEAVGDAKIANNVWMLGWSNWTPDRVVESLRLAKEDAKLPQPVINSPYFSLFEMSARTIHAIGVQVTHKDMMDPEFEKGILIMPYSPLGGFSILEKPEPKWENAKQAAKEKFGKGDPYWQNVYPSIFTEANEARWHRVVEFTKSFNTKQATDYTVDQMMNAYVLAHPRTNLLAVGAITVEQIRRTVKALELSKLLTPADLNYLYTNP